MKKLILILTILSLMVFSKSAYSFSFGGFINSIKKAVNPVKTTSTSKANPQATPTNIVNNQALNHSVQSDSCSYMLLHSPKMAVMNDIANKALIGAGVGAAAGAIVSKNNRVGGAMLGGVLGLVGGALVGTAQHFYELHKPYSAVAMYENYNPALGKDFFKVADLKTQGSVFHVGQYVYIDIRYDILTPHSNRAQLINYYASLYRNGILVSKFFDRIMLPQGEVSDIFYIPVCRGAIDGNYGLKLNIVSAGILNKKNVNFTIK